MMTTEEKLDSLLKAVSDLTSSQQENQRDLDDKLKKLEKDVAAAQQDATERALRKAKRGRSMEFKRKGHQEQFEFNEQVEDHLEAASKKIKKIATPGDNDSKRFLKRWKRYRKVWMWSQKGKSTLESLTNLSTTGGQWRPTKSGRWGIATKTQKRLRKLRGMLHIS